MEINLVDLQTIEINHTFVQQVALQAAQEAGTNSGSLSIALVDEAHITELNQAHRQQAGPTDVLSYEDDTEPEYLGDIVISVETAKRQAMTTNRTLPHEVGWLAAHGVLHLLGYDDTLEAQRAEMIARQDKALETVLKEMEQERP